MKEQITKLSIKEKIYGFLKGIGTIFLYFFVAALYGIFFSKYYESKNLVVATISQVGLYLVLALVLFLIYRKKLIKDLKTFKKENINIAFKNWALGFCVMFISNIIISMFLKDIAVNESINRELLNNYPISNILTMIILGPITEEIAFRLSFKEGFSKWYTFAFVTAFFFGFAHIAEFTLTEFLFLIPYGGLGFFFAKAFYDTDNIYTSIIAHMFHNFIGVLTIFLFA